MPAAPDAPIRIRPAALDDADAIARLAYRVHAQGHGELPPQERRTWIEGYGEDAREQVLGLVEHCTLYVLELDGERVGRLRVVRPADHILLAGLQVLPERQNRGVGTAALRYLLREATARHLPVHLLVAADNPSAERLYRRLGFHRADREGDDYRMVWSPPPGDR